MVQNEPTFDPSFVDEQFEEQLMTTQQYLETFMPVIYTIFDCPPWGVEQYLQSPDVDFTTVTKQQQNKFQVWIKVNNFRDDEISVKMVEGFLIVDASHEEKIDRVGWISRSITRKYKIPDNVDIGAVRCSLLPWGVLSVFAHLKPPPMNESGRQVHIELTGPIRDNLGDHEILVQYSDNRMFRAEDFMNRNF